MPVSDPVFKYYEPHEGEIQSISFSPNRSEMFLSHGTNGEIRIYVLGQVYLLLLASANFYLAFAALGRARTSYISREAFNKRVLGSL